MNIDKLIETINQVITLRFSPLFRLTSVELLQNGCCYDFVKIVQHFYPEAEVYINGDHSHCAAMLNGVLYDGSGILTEKGFHKANDIEMYFINKYFGERFELFEIADTVINEIEKIMTDGVMYEFK